MFALWQRTIDKNDLISIGIEQEGTFLGRVDSISESKAVNTTSFNKTFVITGRNYASMLLDDDIISAYNLSYNARAKELLGSQRATFLGMLRGLTKDGSNIFMNRHPIESILWIMLNMPSIHLNILFADYDAQGNVVSSKTGKIGELFEFDFKANVGDLVYDARLNMYYGKVWNYVAACIDPMFTEVYVDTVIRNGKVKACLFIRPKPFDRRTDNIIKKLVYENKGGTQSAFRRYTINPNFSFGASGDFTEPEKVTDKDGNLMYWDIRLKRSGKDNSGLPTAKPIGWVWDIEDDNQTYNVFTGEATAEGEQPDLTLLNNDYKTMVTNEYYHTIPAHEDWGFSVGHSLKDIFNVFVVNPTKDPLAQSTFAAYTTLFPLIDTYSVKRYGMRKLEGYSNLIIPTLVPIDKLNYQEYDISVPPKFTGEIYTIGQYSFLRDQLFNWNRYNPIFWNGRAIVKGRDKYRIGDKVYFPNHIAQGGYRGIFYYIKTVEQEFQVNGKRVTHTTALDLVRGENRDYLESYRKAAGYDYFDDGQIEKSSIIAINTEASDGTSASNTDKKKEDKKEYAPTNSDNQTDFEGTLTKANIDRMKQKYDSLVKRYMKDGYKDNNNRTGENKAITDINAVSFSDIVEAINNTAALVSMNANIFAAIIWGESKFDPMAVSSTGCSGLGQISMGTWKAGGGNGKIYKQGSGSITNGADARFHPLKNIETMGKIFQSVHVWVKNDFDACRKALKDYGGASSYFTSYLKQFIVGKDGFYPSTRLY